MMVICCSTSKPERSAGAGTKMPRAKVVAKPPATQQDAAVQQQPQVPLQQRKRMRGSGGSTPARKAQKVGPGRLQLSCALHRCKHGLKAAATCIGGGTAGWRVQGHPWAHLGAGQCAAAEQQLDSHTGPCWRDVQGTL